MSEYGYLAHHGVKGMKWGVRNYQNPDGTLTEEGKRRYGNVDNFNKAMNKRAKVIKGLKIAGGVAAGAGVAAAVGAGIYNRDKIKNALIKTPQKAMQKGNLARSSSLAGMFYNKSQLNKYVERNAEKIAANPSMLRNRRTRNAFTSFATNLGDNAYKGSQGGLTGIKLLARATGNATGAEKLYKATSGFEKWLKVIGTGTAAVGTVTAGVMAIRNIANTANNIYATKDLPVVKLGANILKDKGYLDEDSTLYKWILDDGKKK